MLRIACPFCGPRDELEFTFGGPSHITRPPPGDVTDEEWAAYLFNRENPNETEEGQEFTANLNPNSLEVLTGCKLEPGLRDAEPLSHYQFERLGYFCADPDSAPGKPIFNRTVALRDTWAKIEKRQAAPPARKDDGK